MLGSCFCCRCHRGRMLLVLNFHYRLEPCLQPTPVQGYTQSKPQLALRAHRRQEHAVTHIMNLTKIQVFLRVTSSSVCRFDTAHGCFASFFYEQGEPHARFAAF